MRIVIMAPGSRGDVQPYITLGKGLQNVGHSVRLASHSNFESLVTSSGLEFWSLGTNVQDFIENQEMRDLAEKGNFLPLIARMAKEAKRGAPLLAENALQAAQSMDMVLSGIGGLFIGIGIAEKLNLPLVQAYVSPLTPTREFSSVLTPKIPAMLNHLSHHIPRQMIWQGFRVTDRIARKQVWKIPPAPLWGPFNSRCVEKMPILYGFSPAVIPPPSDWPGSIHVTGFWFGEETENWQPPASLLDFLDSGPAPIYFGFGSMSSRNPEKTAELIIEAVKQTNQRAILLSGWGGLMKKDLPESVYMIESIPHSWLFPRVSAVVHHGGASTTAAGLRAGVPSVLIPFLGDQPFWGQRIFELGVGPTPIPRRRLTADRLADAIHEVVSNEDIRRRANELGKQIRSEHGLRNAVEIISRI